MKKFLISLPLLLSFACSESEEPTEVLVKDAPGCTSKDVENGVEFTCGKDTYIVYDGKDGDSCKIEPIDGGYFYTCPGVAPFPLAPVASSDSQTVVKGEKGDKGDKGDKGEDGKDGSQVKIWTDAEGCLWISIDGGEPIKIRHPL